MTRHKPTALLFAGPRDGERVESPTWAPNRIVWEETLRGQGYRSAARVLHDNLTLCHEVWSWRADR